MAGIFLVFLSASFMLFPCIIDSERLDLGLSVKGIEWDRVNDIIQKLSTDEKQGDLFKRDPEKTSGAVSPKQKEAVSDQREAERSVQKEAENRMLYVES